MTFSERLQAILTTLHTSFHPGELAYLAATSKVEGPVRDKIAYQLHAQLGHGFLVNREWRGRSNLWADIAVTDEENRPKYLIELKAHSAPTFEPGYSELIRKDLQKLYQAGESDTELYVIFLFNHLYHPGKLDPKYTYAIKYFPLQNNASYQNNYGKDVTKQTDAHWEKHLCVIGLPLEKSHPGVRIDAGEYHGMPMAVHTYVLGPLLTSDLEGLVAR